MIDNISCHFKKKEDTPVAEKEGHPEESEGEEKGGGDLEERMEELFEAIVTAKDGGRDMAEMFKVLPSREVGQIKRACITIYGFIVPFFFFF